MTFPSQNMPKKVTLPKWSGKQEVLVAIREHHGRAEKQGDLSFSPGLQAASPGFHSLSCGHHYIGATLVHNSSNSRYPETNSQPLPLQSSEWYSHFLLLDFRLQPEESVFPRLASLRLTSTVSCDKFPLFVKPRVASGHWAKRQKIVAHAILSVQFNQFALKKFTTSLDLDFLSCKMKG